jgi:hypothetical protein
MENEFSAKYTKANVGQDAAHYDSELFLRLHDRMARLLPSSELAAALIVRINILLFLSLVEYPDTPFPKGGHSMCPEPRRHSRAAISGHSKREIRSGGPSNLYRSTRSNNLGSTFCWAPQLYAGMFRSGKRAERTRY